MASATHPSYNSAELTTRREFVRMVNRACAELGIAVNWSAEDWIATLRKGDACSFIYGYTFPLNDAGTAGVLRDKAATCRILTDAGVPAVPHSLLRLPALRSVAGAHEAALTLAPLPLVIKPNMGESGGFDVVRCQSGAELDAALSDLATRHQNLAVSPLLPITREFRVVMLAGEPLIIFSKTPAPHEWRHNLRLGATPELVTDSRIADELTTLARRALAATGAQLAAVDIVQTPEDYKIMETNGGISLSSFAKHSPEYAAVAQTAYATLLTAIFATD